MKYCNVIVIQLFVIIISIIINSIIIISRNKLLSYNYCPLMPVNDLYWLDLNVILPLVFQHTVCSQVKVREEFFLGHQ